MTAWFTKNPVAANLLMFGILMVGIYSAFNNIPLETFPSQERDVVNISTSFRGATPTSIEEGITLRVEDAIYDIEGIEKIDSRSTEGSSLVAAEVAVGYDTREILNDIKLRIDALNTLPEAAEKPIISISEFKPAVIYVAVAGNKSDRELRTVAEETRIKLLDLPNISDVVLFGALDYEVSIEVDPSKLRDFNLSLQDVSNAIRQGSIDVSAGSIKTREGDILIRSDGQAYTGKEFAQIPVITTRSDRPILLGDIATINDGFEEQNLITEFDGKPAILLRVFRTSLQSAIEISDEVKQFVVDEQPNVAQGITLSYWDDDGRYVEQRLETLLSSALFGGLLVLILLSLFLRPAIAFWVFLGIPVSFMGALIFLPIVDGSINIITLFAFITVLGIVVDDAIVTSENIYQHLRRGEDPLDAAINGTREISVPVIFGVLTTIVAFLPMAFLTEGRAAFLGNQIPIIVIPVLVFSLIESKLILPAHLRYIKPRKQNENTSKITKLQMRISRWLEEFVEWGYRPALKVALANKSVVLTGLICFSVFIVTYTQLGFIRFTFFPQVDASIVRLNLVMPQNTAFETTTKHIHTIEGHVRTLQEKYTSEQGQSAIQHIYVTSGAAGRSIGSHLGRVSFELTPIDIRQVDVTSRQLSRELRAMVGDIPGAEKLSIRAEIGRSQAPINVELSGSSIQQMGEVVGLIREKLKEYPPIFDIQDNFSGGKDEFIIDLKPEGYALGLNLAQVANQVRHALFGLQSQRIQRGRNEVRVMVRFPKEKRSSLQDLYSLPIKVPNSPVPVPLSDIAEVIPGSSPSTLYRQDRRSILNVTADLDKENANVSAIVADLDVFMRDIIAKYPDISYQYRGEIEEQAESSSTLFSSAMFVLLAIYILLAIPFKSYLQPLIILSIVPFALIGAIVGHIILGKTLSFMSLMGMLALIGVVVNDSLVLVDYINRQRRKGIAVYDAVWNAGAARFRPVILTSITTFAGLAPILLNSAQHTEFLKPMAISLGIGILYATLITLFIIPINYLLAHQCKHGLLKIFRQARVEFIELTNRAR
jgi:multidrug efflux pump subunit AcrB